MRMLGNQLTKILCVTLCCCGNWACEEADLYDWPINKDYMVLNAIGVTSNASPTDPTVMKKGMHMTANVSFSPLEYIESDAICDFVSQYNLSLQIEHGGVSSEIPYVDHIKQNCSEIEHEYNPYVDNVYFEEMNLIAGEDYEVRMQTEKYGTTKAQYEHPEMVPFEVKAFNFLRKGVYLKDMEGWFYELILEIKDPEEPNYYELDFKMLEDAGLSLLSIDHVDRNLDVSINYLFNDKEFNGESKELIIEFVMLPNDWEASSAESTNKNLYVYLRNYSKALHQFMIDEYTQAYTENDPNASPIPVTTNVEGGLGIVGGYAEYLMKVAIPEPE